MDAQALRPNTQTEFITISLPIPSRSSPEDLKELLTKASKKDLRKEGEEWGDRPEDRVAHLMDKDHQEDLNINKLEVTDTRKNS